MEIYKGNSNHLNLNYGNSGTEYIYFKENIHNPVEWKAHKYWASEKCMSKQAGMSDSYRVLKDAERILLL